MVREEDFIELLLTRRSLSPKLHNEIVLPPNVVQAFISVADLVPRHGPKTWHWIEFKDRERLAKIMASSDTKCLTYEDALKKASKGRHVLGLVAAKLPTEFMTTEANFSIGAGLQNMLLLANVLNLAAKTLSSAMDYREGAGYFDPEIEQILMYVTIGMVDEEAIPEKKVHDR